MSFTREVLPVGAVSLAISIAVTFHAFEIYFPSFNTTATSVSGVAHPVTELPLTPGLARHVVFVVVDGLRYEVARELEEFSALRRVGVLRPLEAPPPTYTGPEITAMVTGLAPRDSGVRLNGAHRGVVGIDSVTEELSASGVSIEVDSEAFHPFAGLVRAPSEAKIVEGRVSYVVELVERRAGLEEALPPFDLAHPARKVSFVHIEDVDEAGHMFGAASPMYLEAAHHAGGLVQRIAATLDLYQDALVLVSDHGHIAQGGHGGVEPEVTNAFFLAAGGLFRRGVELGPRGTPDVAPTLSVLAGVRAPTSSLARPMLDTLSLDEASLSVLFAGPFDQAAHFSCRAHASSRCGEVDALVARLAQRDPAAAAEADELFIALERERSRSIDARGRTAARARMAFVALASLGVAAAFGRALRRAEKGALGAAAWIAPLAFAFSYAGYLYGAGARPSFSALRGANGFLRDAVPAGLFAAAVVTAITLIAQLREARRRAMSPSSSIALAPGRLAPWLLLLTLCVPYALLAAYVGWDSTGIAPPLAGVLVLQLGPGLLGGGLSATVMAALVALRRDALSTSDENR